jgi:outer membrane protein assembly factor BamB
LGTAWFVEEWIRRLFFDQGPPSFFSMLANPTYLPGNSRGSSLFQVAFEMNGISPHSAGLGIRTLALAALWLARLLCFPLATGYSASDSTSVQTAWPKFRGDLLNTGYSTSAAPHTASLAWSKKIPGAQDFWSSPSVLNDRLYVGNSNGNLYCINAAKGDLIWTFYGNSYAIFSSPTIANGMIFFGGADRKIYALPADDPNSDGTISEAEILWDFTVGPSTGGVNDVVPSSPAIKDGKVFIGAIDQYFYCFNANTGKILWKTWTPYRGQHAFSSSPALFKGKVFAATGNQPGMDSSGRLYCFNEATGGILWEFDIDDITYSSPVIDKDNDRVVIANSGDWIANAGNRRYRLYSLAIEGQVEGGDAGIPDSHVGKSDLIWSFDTKRYVYSSPAIHDGKLYFGGSDGNLRCVDARTGKLTWVYETPAKASGVMSSPAIADGMVFVGTADGRLVAVPENDPNGDGMISPNEIVWSYEIGGKLVCSPAIANGAVYIGSYDGVMYCFRTAGRN